MTANRTQMLDEPNSESDGSGPSDHSLRLSRRTLMAGAAGVAALGLPAAALAEDITRGTPGHTLQTYRSIADAMIPRTEESGVDGDGALDVELERFLIASTNFGTEVEEGSGNEVARRRALRVELSVEDGGLAQLVAGLEAELDFSAERDLGMEPEEIFGSLVGLDHRIERDGGSRLLVESVADGEIERTTVTGERVPLATFFAAALDLYALLLVLGEGNQEPLAPGDAFLGGGLFTFLAPADRMRCLLFASSEADQLEGVVEALLPDSTTVTELVGTTLVSGLVGYYSEWAGYGETKTEPPLERELQMPVSAVQDEVQAYRQIGWDGPVDGNAGYEDPPIAEFRENDWEDDDDDWGWWR